MRHVISTTAVAFEPDDDASSALRQGASSLVMMMTMTFHLRVVCEEEWSPERRKKTGSIVAALPSSLACRSAARAAVARAPSTESSPSSPSTA